MPDLEPTMVVRQSNQIIVDNVTTVVMLSNTSSMALVYIYNYSLKSRAFKNRFYATIEVDRLSSVSEFVVWLRETIDIPPLNGIVCHARRLEQHPDRFDPSDSLAGYYSLDPMEQPIVRHNQRVLPP